MPSMIVSGAGTSAVNGTYAQTGTQNSKPYYCKSGSSAFANAISWSGALWYIYDAFGFPAYESNNNVATPDLVTTWTANTGSNPVPTVTAAASGGLPPPRQGRYGAAGRASSY